MVYIDWDTTLVGNLAAFELPLHGADAYNCQTSKLLANGIWGQVAARDLLERFGSNILTRRISLATASLPILLKSVMRN